MPIYSLEEQLEFRNIQIDSLNVALAELQNHLYDISTLASRFYNCKLEWAGWSDPYYHKHLDRWQRRRDIISTPHSSSASPVQDDSMYEDRQRTSESLGGRANHYLSRRLINSSPTTMSHVQAELLCGDGRRTPEPPGDEEQRHHDVQGDQPEGAITNGPVPIRE